MEGRSSIAILAFIMVCSLAGVGTMAWFVDSSTSSSNEIQSGRLEIGITEAGEIPQPLFRTSYAGTRFADSGYDDGAWYPGKETLRDRGLTIMNKGTMPLRVCGISARLNGFTKNAVQYDINDPDLNQGIKDSYEEFTQNLIITVENSEDKIIYEGSLKDLLSKVQPLSILNQDSGSRANYYDRLATGEPVDYDFRARMLTSAGNAAQGTSADVDLVIHATQDKNEAVAQLVGSN